MSPDEAQGVDADFHLAKFFLNSDTKLSLTSWRLFVYFILHRYYKSQSLFSVHSHFNPVRVLMTYLLPSGM
jgi:hypothetical protein